MPRSTVARSAEAHITKVISKSSLRSDNSNQTSAGRVVGDGVVWAALPEVWWGWLGRSARERVVKVVQAGLSAGWTPEAIRARLAGNALPPRDQVRNLEGLIISRVRGVVSDPAPVVVEVDPREHAQRRLEVCHQILAGTCSLSAREQVTVANSAVNDPLLRAEAELTLEAFTLLVRAMGAMNNLTTGLRWAVMRRPTKAPAMFAHSRLVPMTETQ